MPRPALARTEAGACSAGPESSFIHPFAVLDSEAKLGKCRRYRAQTIGLASKRLLLPGGETKAPR